MDDVYEIRGGRILKRFIAIWILVSAGLNIWQMDRIRVLEEKRPMVIYKADNAGAEIFGKVVEKGRHGKLYTLTIRDYGVFVVTKDVYEKVKVGLLKLFKSCMTCKAVYALKFSKQNQILLKDLKVACQ